MFPSQSLRIQTQKTLYGAKKKEKKRKKKDDLICPLPSL
jgi:hypothetical protein